MQTDSTREGQPPEVLQPSHSPSAKIGRSEVLAQVQKAVVKSVDANPKMPALQLIEVIITEADTALTASLDDILRRDFYAHAVRAERRSRAANAQLRLPGFEHLPRTIPGPKGEPVPLIEASYTRVRAYFRSLMVAHRNRRINDPKIKEAKALMEKMEKRFRKDKGVTVGQVVRLSA